MTDLALWLSLAALAVVQGITEFLPVSSSGHLAIAQMLLHVGEGSLVEDIVLHLGTLVAVIIFYRSDLWQLTRGSVASGESGSRARTTIALLVLGNVPAGIVGVFFKDRIETLFDSLAAVIVAMAATAVLLLSTRWMRRGERLPTARIALVVGLAQAVAILPGASRSGWTIAAGLAMGLAPAEAVRFSFLLSIPAIAGAALLQFLDLEGAQLQWGPLGLAFVLAAITGIFCLRWLVALARRMALHRFAYYLALVVVIGVVTLVMHAGGATH